GWLPSTELIILDEIHKMKEWKNYLKGLYDTKPKHQKILVTGSARLEIFKEVGDSLAGRYYLHRLFPLSPAECSQVGAPFTLARFLERGGFPEPFLEKALVEANRWRKQYIDSLLHIDVLDFENIQNVRAIRLIFELLRRRVGSPVSYSSLARDAEISPHTVKKYIRVLEALYIVFLIPPFSKNIGRSLLKEPKVYFFDQGLVEGDEGACFENLVATSLLKHVHAQVDQLGEDAHLRYLRTKDHAEVDFALVKKGKLTQVIEAKLKDKEISPHLRMFHEKYQLPAIQLVKNLRQERMDQGIEVRKALGFLSSLLL
ncbi:MAG: ATP-binding protein, partial [Chlamydiia bacterium]|nr:ATP-binding protein [Chlamydiia bacterium]